MNLAESFGRSGFAKYVNTASGRIVRIIAGLAILGWGYVQLPGPTGIVLIIVGLVPLTAGFFNTVSPLLKPVNRDVSNDWQDNLTLSDSRETGGWSPSFARAQGCVDRTVDS